jgi:hypothetical protein
MIYLRAIPEFSGAFVGSDASVWLRQGDIFNSQTVKGSSEASASAQIAGHWLPLGQLFRSVFDVPWPGMPPVGRTRIRPVPGYIGIWASSDGHVYTERRYRRLLDGLRQLPERDVDGYRKVSVRLVGGGWVKRGVHRLVLLAFAGPRPDGLQAGHRNGVRADNRIQNLRYVTPKQNAADRRRHNKTVRGSKHGRAKLTDHQAVMVIRLAGKGESLTKLARALGVDISTLSRIARRLTWSHLKVPRPKRRRRKAPSRGLKRGGGR